MKSVISIIGLISTINGSSRLLQQLSLPLPSLDCASLTCLAPSGCVDGIGCIPLCNDASDCESNEQCIDGVGCVASCTDVSDCSLGQQCSGGICVETCGGILPIVCSIENDQCIDNPLDDCDPENGGADCGGFCLAGSQTDIACGANEVFNDCGTACPAVCGATGPTICTLQCVRGCECAPGFILDQAGGSCIAPEECPAPPTGGDVCPLRCTGGYDGCNICGCDGLGNPTFCTLRACTPAQLGPAECRGCELGYELNTDTNTCDSAKVSCTSQPDCDTAAGFKCRKDPECEVYSDVTDANNCGQADKVCVSPKNQEVACPNGNNDCDLEDGFGCLNGDIGVGVCIKYQSL